jgi:nucleoside 2-deoxyribosyltransferase
LSNGEPKLTIYLAGPISHCNERQKCEWRKTPKTALHKKGYACIDPADHTVDWHTHKEIIDIDKSDVVIANLWRESIGTVIGIVKARRSGKPVILVAPDYIDSAVLAEIVGEDHIVRNLGAAINKLDRGNFAFESAYFHGKEEWNNSSTSRIRNS